MALGDGDGDPGPNARSLAGPDPRRLGREQVVARVVLVSRSGALPPRGPGA